MATEFPEYKGTKASILIKATLDWMHEPGQVFEVRIPKTKFGTISGYFNDTAIAALAIAKENGRHQAVYTTLNPVDPNILARNENKLVTGQLTTTTDQEIIRRRWFPIDLDPIRPSGISSSDTELDAARQRANEVRDWLTSLGWPAPIEALSGNGAHLLYAVNAPVDEKTRIDFEFALKGIATAFDDDKVKVDTVNWNASRVWKIYGTIAAKGSSTAERPHRVAMLAHYPENLQEVDLGLISHIASVIRDANAEQFKDMTGEFIGDMTKWLSERGVTVTSGPRPLFGTEGQKWAISQCPFNHQHTTSIVGLINNRPIFKCLHNSCTQYGWKEFREKIDPSFKDPDVVYQRLKEWCLDDSKDIPDKELIETAARTGRQLPKLLARLKKEVPRTRFVLVDDAAKQSHRDFIKETIGENNEKGNIVGIINRVRTMQAEGIVPSFWMADFDHRLRAGDIGDIDCPKVGEADEISLLVRFHGMGDTWVSQTICAQAIKHLAAQHCVNPLRQYFKRFIWDGTPRLSTWLPDIMGTENTPYTRAVGRKWLISAVARGMDPGCQADHMLIFEGTQGIGKSRALRVLGGDFYAEYISTSKAVSAHKDMVHIILGKLIIEMSELATIKKADVEWLKAILTITKDDARLSYERDAKTYPRTCVFAGTTNDIRQGYIADSSGARRFWPVVAGEVRPPRLDILAEVRDQLWAEAVEAYESGEDWWTVPAEDVAREQEERQITPELADPWYGAIRNALTISDHYNDGCFYVVDRYDNGQPTGRKLVRAGPAHTILGIALGIPTERQSKIDLGRVLAILKSIGFTKSKPSRGWCGSTYAHDLREESLEHLWPAIIGAAEAARNSKFSKEGQGEPKF